MPNLKLQKGFLHIGILVLVVFSLMAAGAVATMAQNDEGQRSLTQVKETLKRLTHQTGNQTGNNQQGQQQDQQRRERPQVHVVPVERTIVHIPIKNPLFGRIAGAPFTVDPTFSVGSIMPGLLAHFKEAPAQRTVFTIHLTEGWANHDLLIPDYGTFLHFLPANVISYLGKQGIPTDVAPTTGDLPTMTPIYSTSPSTSSKGCLPVGDVNNDGKVDGADAAAITNYIAGRGTIDPYKGRADVDASRTVDQIDAQLILQYSQNLITTFPGCSDNDNDGFNNTTEVYIGTDPNVACGVNAWPPDFDNNRAINIDDIFKINSKIGSADMRYDLNLDGTVNIFDVNIVRNNFGKTCK